MKFCSRCNIEKPFTEFHRRALSPDGFAASCKVCLNEAKRALYWVAPGERSAQIRRATESKAARFRREPAYRRAFVLWGSTKKRRTKIPPWVGIADFVPICQQAIDAGPGHELDHILPLQSALVCGLHVPANMQVLTVAAHRAKTRSERHSS